MESQQTEVARVQQSDDFDNICQTVVAHIKSSSKRNQCRKSQMRLFTTSDASPHLRFIANDSLREHQSKVIESCYIFKLFSKQDELYTHGIYIGLIGYLSRHRLNQFVLDVINFVTDNKLTAMKHVTPFIHKYQSLYNYMHTLYLLPKNLLYTYANVSDSVSIETTEVTLNHANLNDQIRLVRSSAKLLLDNFIAVPALYSKSLLYRMLQFDAQQYTDFMRYTTIYDVIGSICDDAYNYALQSIEFPKDEVQHLMNPLTKQSIVNDIHTEKVQKQIQLMLKQHCGSPFVHPSPLSKLHTSDQFTHGVFEGLLFDAKFLLSVLMVGRWFAKVCIQHRDNITNNHAHLVLYGQSGAGKSLLLSALQKCIPTYTYLTGGSYQNPDILASALLYFGEFDTKLLVTNQYKDLFDIKSSVKLDFKNLHPENVSQNVPCILSTNDDILSVLRVLPGKRQSHFTNTPPTNVHSVDAALRRMYPVPFKLGKFTKLHANTVPSKEAQFTVFAQYDTRFEKEPHRLSRIFNLIFAFALFQTDIANFDLRNEINVYIRHTVSSFIKSYFGQFYYKNKTHVDDILLRLEQTMERENVNDSEYAIEMADGAWKLGQLINQFISDNSSNNFKDALVASGNNVSAPLRLYYLMDQDVRFKNLLADPIIFTYALQ